MTDHRRSLRLYVFRQNSLALETFWSYFTTLLQLDTNCGHIAAIANQLGQLLRVWEFWASEISKFAQQIINWFWWVWHFFLCSRLRRVEWQYCHHLISLMLCHRCFGKVLIDRFSTKNAFSHFGRICHLIPVSKLDVCKSSDRRAINMLPDRSNGIWQIPKLFSYIWNLFWG